MNWTPDSTRYQRNLPIAEIRSSAGHANLFNELLRFPNFKHFISFPSHFRANVIKGSVRRGLTYVYL